jgi:osmotically inducible lipoprotein OsmB
MLRTAAIVSAAALLLTACGETRLDRGLSGAAIGAGVGAVASAATGASSSAASWSGRRWGPPSGC